MSLSQKRVEELIDEVTGRYSGAFGSGEKAEDGRQGCFEDIDAAVLAARAAQRRFSMLGLEHRAMIIRSMRESAQNNAKYLALMAYEETGFGRVEDKHAKNLLAARKTPGIEDLVSTTFTGDSGLTLVEGAPYGVIGALTPSTNPAATVINNSICMVAAGNSVVFNPHPGAKKVTLETIRLLNEAIEGTGGPSGLLCTVRNPTLETSRLLMGHKDVRLLAVTGGEAVVDIALKSGKKVIAAGPGNPPVIVDNTADIPKAASDIVKGASFDNNILCIAEKEVFVFREVADWLINELIRNGCYKAGPAETEELFRLVLERGRDGGFLPNKKYIGKNAAHILESCEIKADTDYRLIIAEVDAGHPFVTTEMLLPVLPVVRVDGLEEAVEKAVMAENGRRHTAVMHSQNVTNLTRAARALDTTIFVKNAPSYSGLGLEGEGFTSLTIATPTGEGLTSARSFTRQRRCTLSGAFRII